MSTCTRRWTISLSSSRLRRKAPFIMHPGTFCLGLMMETITLPDDIVARVDGKSSLGRLGLLVHATAGYVDPGWTGKTLHLYFINQSQIPAPIALYYGMRIAAEIGASSACPRRSTGRTAVRRSARSTNGPDRSDAWPSRISALVLPPQARRRGAEAGTRACSRCWRSGHASQPRSRHPEAAQGTRSRSTGCYGVVQDPELNGD